MSIAIWGGGAVVFPRIQGADVAGRIVAVGDDVSSERVGGPGFSMCFNLLCRGGRYVTSGAIAGPIVEFDLRTLYLKDL